MPRSGLKGRKNIHLSQKRICGNIDKGAGVYGGCCAYERSRQFREYCVLGYKVKDHIPLEPCLKPVTVSQLCYAREYLLEELA